MTQEFRFDLIAVTEQVQIYDFVKMPGIIARGDKSEARTAEVLREEVVTPPHQLGVWGSTVSSPSGCPSD